MRIRSTTALVVLVVATTASALGIAAAPDALASSVIPAVTDTTEHWDADFDVSDLSLSPSRAERAAYDLLARGSEDEEWGEKLHFFPPYGRGQGTFWWHLPFLAVEGGPAFVGLPLPLSTPTDSTFRVMVQAALIRIVLEKGSRIESEVTQIFFPLIPMSNVMVEGIRVGWSTGNVEHVKAVSDDDGTYYKSVLESGPFVEGDLAWSWGSFRFNFEQPRYRITDQTTGLTVDKRPVLLTLSCDVFPYFGARKGRTPDYFTVTIGYTADVSGKTPELVRGYLVIRYAMQHN
jgi:hypothetical protein